MSFLIAAAVMAACVVSAGVLARRWRTRDRAPVLGEKGEDWPFAVQVGDVVCIADEELCIQGAWVLSEAKLVVGALFLASERALVSLVKPSPQSFLVSQVSVDLPEQAPSVVEFSGRRFERQWRLPVSVRAAGEDEAPWPEALFCYYRGFDDEVLFVLGRERVQRVWLGRRVPAAQLDVWGNSESSD
jgi:hypothetical protein